ncbi:MAG: lipoyl(octanoyl) transferase LipB [Deltaproteobacteria bacterium]|nr:lipoyl(octanoyl) transferase LipB [Deltaproteobacteria bacterium]
MNVRDIGLVPYRQAWQLQEELRTRRIAGEIGDQFLLVEHPPVYTLGKRDCDKDLLVPREMVAREGIEVVKTNRGGRVTYHGPGQMAGYFICSLDEQGISVPEFVRRVEELVIQVLADVGIDGERDPEYPGVWVGRDKIAAIGLNFSHRVSQHGFALNVSPNLDHYRFIIPCGITDRGVTSMEKILGRVVPMAMVKERVMAHVHKLFGLVRCPVGRGEGETAVRI